jgi:hypothetical protein
MIYCSTAYTLKYGFLALAAAVNGAWLCAAWLTRLVPGFVCWGRSRCRRLLDVAAEVQATSFEELNAAFVEDTLNVRGSV